MKLEEIRDLQLPAADDCALFLWTTHAFIYDSFDLLKNWGFEYKAMIVWDKIKMGMGNNLRMQNEFCVMGFKGHPTVNRGRETDHISEKRRQHSRKPEKFYQFVDRYVIGKKLDYFSRENREGWDSYGVECDKFSNLN